MRKFNVEFSDEAAETLAAIARLKETSKTEVVRQSLNTYSFLEKELRNGGKFYIESPDGEKIRYILP